MSGISYAIAFARRYAEQGDHQVAGEALNVVVAINALYVRAKGKTFFSHHFMIENPFASDAFINDTLENLRQTVLIGITRGDEQQIEQTLRAIAMLVPVYAEIDYTTPYATMTHAHLAAGYLSQAVEATVRLGAPDVLMEGMRLMGQSATQLLGKGDPDGIATLVDKIGVISGTGIASDKFRPVTMGGIEQLARLTIILLQMERGNVEFALGEIKKTVSFVANLFLQIPDSPLSNIHSTYLGPYYSGTKTDSLKQWLRILVNKCLEAKDDDAKAASTISNIAEWADELVQPEKELLLIAIEKRSHLTFDLIHWIIDVSEMLLALATAPACRNARVEEDLRKHAIWLISVLSWIPDDQETSKFIETFQMTEKLFDAAWRGRQRDCPEFARTASDLLLRWGMRAGRYRTGWGILERSVCGLATLALLSDAPEVEVSRLREKLQTGLSQPNGPAQEERDRAARDIRERAATLYGNPHWSSRIENAMASVDPEKLEALLEELADLISPGTADEPVRPPLF